MQFAQVPWQIGVTGAFGLEASKGHYIDIDRLRLPVDERRCIMGKLNQAAQEVNTCRSHWKMPTEWSK